VKPTDVPIVEAEIRIIYGIDDDGTQVISTSYAVDGEDDWLPPYFTGLVMFEDAKIDFLQQLGIMMIPREDEADE